MKTAIISGERYFGVEIAPDGRIVVAERIPGRVSQSLEFPSGSAGAQALRRHIERESSHPHVCIAACGAAALNLASTLIPAPGMEVTIVRGAAIQQAAPAHSPEERAARLARLAERLF